MDKKKQGLLGGGILVLALIAAVGIVYAAYNQTLTINGTAQVKANSWEIGFTNLSAIQKTGSASEVTTPTISADQTTIGDYSVILSKPGDSITYNFDIINKGTFNAEALVSSITGLEPTCKGTGDNADDDAANVCKYLTYEWIIPPAYNDNGVIKLNANENKNNTLTGFGIKLTYANKDGADIPKEDLPKNDVAVTGLSTSITFKQAK